jgi:hypothetical protein
MWLTGILKKHRVWSVGTVGLMASHGPWARGWLRACARLNSMTTCWWKPHGLGCVETDDPSNSKGLDGSSIYKASILDSKAEILDSLQRCQSDALVPQRIKFVLCAAASLPSGFDQAIKQ